MTNQLATVELAYEAWHGEGVAIVLLHGFPSDRSLWRGEALQLAGMNRSVVCPDLRGFGHSPVASTASIDEMAADVIALMDLLGHNKFVVIGFSMGGYVALRIALEYSERVVGLGLIDTRAEADSPQGKQQRQATIEAIRRGGLNFMAEGMSPGMIAAKTIADKPNVAREANATILRQSPAGVIAAAQGMIDRLDVSTRLQEISVPTLVVVGDEDGVTPWEPSGSTLAQIEDCTVVRVAEAGHLVPLEQPDALHAAIASWLGTFS